MNSIQQSIKKAQDIMKNKNEIQNQERQKMILENAEKMTKQYRQANENIRNFIQDPNSIEMQSLVSRLSMENQLWQAQ
jgi:predicted lipase